MSNVSQTVSRVAERERVARCKTTVFIQGINKLPSKQTMSSLADCNINASSSSHGHSGLYNVGLRFRKQEITDTLIHKEE